MDVEGTDDKIYVLEITKGELDVHGEEVCYYLSLGKCPEPSSRAEERDNHYPRLKPTLHHALGRTSASHLHNEVYDSMRKWGWRWKAHKIKSVKIIPVHAWRYYSCQLEHQLAEITQEVK